MIKAVVFDFDDTIIHTYENFLDNIRMIAGELGLSVPPMNKVLDNYGNGWKEYVKSVVPSIDLVDFINRYQILNSTRIYRPVRGAHETLDILSKKMVLGVITGGPKQIFMDNMAKAGIDFKKFSFMLSRDEIKKSKSDSSFFNPVSNELEKLGIRKEEILYVGDSKFDQEVAKNAGIHFVGVLTGPTTREELENKGVKNIIPSVMDLPSFINKL